MTEVSFKWEAAILVSLFGVFLVSHEHAHTLFGGSHCSKSCTVTVPAISAARDLPTRSLTSCASAVAKVQVEAGLCGEGAQDGCQKRTDRGRVRLQRSFTQLQVNLLSDGVLNSAVNHKKNKEDCCRTRRDSQRWTFGCSPAWSLHGFQASDRSIHRLEDLVLAIGH